MRRQLLLAAALGLTTSVGHADLIVTKVSSEDDVIVHHCGGGPRPVCTKTDHISHRQLKEISGQVARMTFRRLLTMVATLKAMPYIVPPIRTEYGTFRRTSGHLNELVKNVGTITIPEDEEGSGPIVELFDRAIAARAAHPEL